MLTKDLHPDSTPREVGNLEKVKGAEESGSGFKGADSKDKHSLTVSQVQACCALLQGEAQVLRGVGDLSAASVEE